MLGMGHGCEHVGAGMGCGYKHVAVVMGVWVY